MPAPRPHGYTQGLAVQRYRPIASVVCLALLAAPGVAQSLPPGHIDPVPILDAAAAAMGVDQLHCVSLAGEGYAGMVGQNMTQDTDWPRGSRWRTICV